MNSFNVKNVIWDVIIVCLFVFSSLLDVKGLAHLWDFVSYLLPVFGMLIYTTMAIVILNSSKPQVKSMSANLVRLYQPNNMFLVILDATFYAVFVLIFAYQGEVARAIIWLSFLSCKSLLFVALRASVKESVTNEKTI